MSLADDLVRMAHQEQVLIFPRFDASDAWDLGVRLREMAIARDAKLAIEVRLAGQTVFFCLMPGATPGNADWARRKRNAVERIHEASYRIGRGLEAKGQTLQDPHGLPMADYASHGGSFPIRVDGVGVVGSVTISGLPQREDHAMVVEALAAMCGEPLDGLRLGPAG